MKTKKRVTSYILASLYFASITLALLQVSQPTAYAEQTQTPRDRAKVFQAAKGLGECIVKSGINDPATKEKIQSGTIFAQTEGNVKVGYIIDPEDGNVNCNTPHDVKLLYSVLKIDGVGFFEKAGIYEGDPNDAKQYIATLRERGSDANEKRANTLYDYINKEFGVDARTSLSEASQYITLKFAYDRACKIRQYKKTDENGTDARDVLVVNDKGELSTEFWTINKENLQNVGYGLKGDGGSDQRMMCETIRIQMNSTADDYSAKIKRLIDQGVDTSIEGSVTGGADTEGAINNETCEEDLASPLAWIACPLLGAMEDSINFLFNIADELLNVDAQAFYGDDGLRQTWSYFRGIATFSLLAIALVMILSQAMGGNR